MHTGIVTQVGMIPYNAAHDIQLDLVDKLHRHKWQRDVCLLLQHEPVFTLGRHAGSGNINVSGAVLKQLGIDLVKTERGGEITYHGPGQLICYPIVDLRRLGLRVADYVPTLEQIMIDVVAEFGISAGRDRRNHGVWCGSKKLGSVGIALRHGISYHGFALNVNPDLAPFSWINPCGMSGVKMTSMVEICQHKLRFCDVETSMISQLNSVFCGQGEEYATSLHH